MILLLGCSRTSLGSLFDQLYKRSICFWHSLILEKNEPMDQCQVKNTFHFWLSLL